MQNRQRQQLAAACASSNILLKPPPRRRSSPGPSKNPRDGNSPASDIPDVDGTFRPEFVPRSHGPKVNNPAAMEIDAYDDTLFLADERHATTVDSTKGASFLATARANYRQTGSCRRNTSGEHTVQHHKTKKSGLVRLLQEVKSEIRNDGTRLRSGEYPFPHKTSRFDLYDPRNRAASYMDVTLLGESFTACPSTTGPGCSRTSHSNTTLAIVGYIHTYHHYQERDIVNAELSFGACQNLAWICFSSVTLQEHNLLKTATAASPPPRGYQLRIYNAVACRAGEYVEGLAEDGLSKVICTQLCEPYPANVLGSLQPDLSELELLTACPA